MMMMNKKPGDWNCIQCSHLNFNRRDTCQRCGQPRCDGSLPRTTAVLPGDWYCSCGAHNFASRCNCYSCGASRTTGGGAVLGDASRWKSGDWLCTSPGCNEHNFASRTECFRCNTPRTYSYGAEF